MREEITAFAPPLRHAGLRRIRPDAGNEDGFEAARDRGCGAGCIETMLVSEMFFALHSYMFVTRTFTSSGGARKEGDE
jgi:hypothetical protein